MIGASDLPTSMRHTALFAAVCNNDVPMARELLEKGSDPYQCSCYITYTLVFTAVRYRHLEMLKFLLSYGLDPDDVGGDYAAIYIFPPIARPDVPSTPLTAAVNNLDKVMVAMLLSAGADPNRKSCGMPPLHMSMANAYFPPGETVGYYETIERSHEIIDLLMQNGPISS